MFQETIYSKDSGQKSNTKMAHLVSTSGNVVINDFLSRERQILNQGNEKAAAMFHSQENPVMMKRKARQRKTSQGERPDLLKTK
jgi:hypothetical protein